MRIRDALESDAEALAVETGRPANVLVDTIHDRTVRVAIDDGDADCGVDAPASLDGFVAFDVRGGTVHVTDFAGTPHALERLIEEPKRFAEREGMDVEALVVDGEQRRAGALSDAGFVAVGPGPRFDGDATTRFRLERDE